MPGNTFNDLEMLSSLITTQLLNILLMRNWRTETLNNLPKVTVVVEMKYEPQS